MQACVYNVLGMSWKLNKIVTRYIIIAYMLLRLDPQLSIPKKKIFENLACDSGNIPSFIFRFHKNAQTSKTGKLWRHFFYRLKT